MTTLDNGHFTTDNNGHSSTINRGYFATVNSGQVILGLLRVTCTFQSEVHLGFSGLLAPPNQRYTWASRGYLHLPIRGTLGLLRVTCTSQSEVHLDFSGYLFFLSIAKKPRELFGTP
jgi:hypothetical protein